MTKNLPNVPPKANGRVQMSRGMSAFLEKLVNNPGVFGQIARKMRRMYYGIFRKDYVAKSIKEERKGECHRCGMCCKLVFNCPFLGEDAQKLPYCRIYGDLRPANCHNYPFDKVDSEVAQCGFKFK